MSVSPFSKQFNEKANEHFLSLHETDFSWVWTFFVFFIYILLSQFRTGTFFHRKLGLPPQCKASQDSHARILPDNAFTLLWVLNECTPLWHSWDTILSLVSFVWTRKQWKLSSLWIMTILNHLIVHPLFSSLRVKPCWQMVCSLNEHELFIVVTGPATK